MKGDIIEFDYEETKYGLEVKDDNFDSIKVIGQAEDGDQDDDSNTAAPQERKPRPNRGRSSGTVGTQSSRDAYWERKEQRDEVIDRRVSYAAARNAAIEFVSKLFAIGALTFAAKAKDNEKVGLFENAVAKYAAQFYQDTMDDAFLTNLQTAGDVPDAQDEGSDSGLDDDQDIPY